jgi:hypothetical protein
MGQTPSTLAARHVRDVCREREAPGGMSGTPLTIVSTIVDFRRNLRMGLLPAYW